MYVCLLNQEGEIMLHRNMQPAPRPFLKAVAPYRDALVVAVECIFTWYWLADLCAREGIPFVLGHALYMKAIHGGKAKNDTDRRPQNCRTAARGDAPAGLRLSCRHAGDPRPAPAPDASHAKRAELLAHIQNTNRQYNLPEIGKKLAYKANRDGRRRAVS